MTESLSLHIRDLIMIKMIFYSQSTRYIRDSPYFVKKFNEKKIFMVYPFAKLKSIDKVLPPNNSLISEIWIFTCWGFLCKIWLYLTIRMAEFD